MKKSIIYYFVIFLFLSSCSSNYVNLVVVSDEEPKFTEPEKVKLISQNTREYHFEFSPEKDSTELKIQVKGKKYSFKIGPNGYYLLNLTDEMIVSSQFKYESEMSARFNNAPINDKLDSINEKMDSINKANDPDQTKDLVNLDPGKMERLTKSLNVKVYGFTEDAPERIEIKSNQTAPITFQLYTNKRYQEMFMEELQKMIKERTDSTGKSIQIN
jgi:hypothetical protein